MKYKIIYDKKVIIGFGFVWARFQPIQRLESSKFWNCYLSNSKNLKLKPITPIFWFWNYRYEANFKRQIPKWQYHFGSWDQNHYHYLRCRDSPFRFHS